MKIVLIVIGIFIVANLWALFVAAAMEDEHNEKDFEKWKRGKKGDR